MLRLLLTVLLACGALLPSWALELPGTVREAVRLELAGRLTEALEAYRSALSSEESLIQDESAAKSETIYTLVHAANIAIDLGYGEEAAVLATRLKDSPQDEAQFKGLAIQMRLLRLEGRPQDAIQAYEAVKDHTSCPVSVRVERERSLELLKQAPESSPSKAAAGPELWWHSGQAQLLPSAADTFGLKVEMAVKLPLGAFRSWDNALTLIDMLREKGWSPLTDVKRTSGAPPLYLVSILSRQPETDRKRLKDQDLLP